MPSSASRTWTLTPTGSGPNATGSSATPGSWPGSWRDWPTARPSGSRPPMTPRGRPCPTTTRRPRTTRRTTAIRRPRTTRRTTAIRRPRTTRRTTAIRRPRTTRGTTAIRRRPRTTRRMTAIRPARTMRAMPRSRLPPSNPALTTSRVPSSPTRMPPPNPITGMPPLSPITGMPPLSATRPPILPTRTRPPAWTPGGRPGRPRPWPPMNGREPAGVAGRPSPRWQLAGGLVSEAGFVFIVRVIDVMHLGRERVIGCWQVDDVLIDPGPGSTLPVLLDALGDERPRAVLLTHIHPDHAGATGALLERWPDVEVYVHELGAPHLIDPSRLIDSAMRLYGDRMDRLWGEMLPVPERNLHVLTGGERLLGGRFEVAYTPGHASHHVSYRHDTTAFVGDVGGVRIAEGWLPLPPPPPPDIDVEAWHESLDMIAAWKPERLAMTHFGAGEDGEQQLTEVGTRLDDWRSEE